MSPLVPNTVDAVDLAAELAQFRVVNPDRLSDLLAEFAGGGAIALAELLVRRGLVTVFQVERALAGEAKMIALGPYRLTDTHRVGAFGPVFRAEPAPGSHGTIATPAPRTSPSADLDRTVAVRVFPLRSLWRAKQAHQLARRISAIPPHPSVVPLVAAGSANGFHYLAWPLVVGPTIADRVAADGPLPPNEVAGILAQLLDALAACHARNIVHGVITPQTVVAAPSAPARLLDLGVGTILTDDLSSGEALLDTLSTATTAAEVLDFAAPELVANPTRPTPAADQYAVGAVGYFAITGQPPFPGRTLTDRLLARESGTPVPVASVNPAVPPEMAAVLDRMLRPDPADRFVLLGDAQLELAAVAGASSLSGVVSAAPVIGSHGSDRVQVGSNSGSVSWVSSGMAGRPPERDDSAASITFELPESPASPPAPPVQPVDTPRSTVWETRPSPAVLPADREVRKPPSPETPSSPSPLRSDTSIMAKTRLPDPAGGPNPPLPPTKPTDPRLSMPTPVHWHTSDPAPPVAPTTEENPPATSDDAPGTSALWKRLRRTLLFWQTPTDMIQASVFGPVALTPGRTARVCVVLHPPEAAESVRTLARAVERDAELLGTAALVQEVSRGAKLAVHLSVTNAGLDRSLLTFTWRGQPYRANFDLHVPWESPGGPAPGLVSVGHDNVRIGKVEFHLRILPRKG